MTTTVGRKACELVRVQEGNNALAALVSIFGKGVHCRALRGCAATLG
jgi:hypothetical protein